MHTTDRSTIHAPLVPNHHAHYPPFAGWAGYRYALLFAANPYDGAKQAADLVELGADDVLVDIGSGAGNGVREAARRGATAIGVEPSAEMRRVATWLTRNRHATYLDGSAEHLPVHDGSATVVWSIACVHHWADLDAGLAEVHRVLQPGGRFLAVERRCAPGADGVASHGWTDQQVATFAEVCRAAGFVDVVVHDEVTRRGRGLAVLCRRP